MSKNSDDLFDNVKLPKERDDPASQAVAAPMREAAPAGQQLRAGVPASRLWGWAAPLLLVVTVIVLWAVSVWLLLAVAVAAVLGVLVTMVVRHWQRRKAGRLSRSSSAGPLLGGGRSGSARTGRGRTGSGLGRFGRGSGRGLGGGRASGSGQRLGGRSKGSAGRGRFGTASRDGQGSKAEGRTGRGRSRFGSLFSPGRIGTGARGGSRTGAGRNGTGTAGGAKRTGRRTGSGAATGTAGLRGGKWTTSRANPATWVGQRRRAAQAVRQAVKSKRRGKRAPARKDTTKQPQDKTTETPDSKRPWWKPWRAKSYIKGGDALKTETTDTKPKREPNPKAQNRSQVKSQATTNPLKQAKQQHTQVTATDKKLKSLADARRVKSTDEKLKDLSNAKSQFKSPKAQNRRQSPQPAADFDDMGFPSGPGRKPKPRHLNVDDGGFISPPPTKPQPKGPKAITHDTRRSTITMSDRTADTAATQIDASTPETFRASTQAAADELRKDANKKETKASELRVQAQGWIEKELPAAAQPLLAEAARLEEVATKRRQGAAAYETYAETYVQ